MMINYRLITVKYLGAVIQGWCQIGRFDNHVTMTFSGEALKVEIVRCPLGPLWNWI